jgi:hypothetical protein
MWNQYRKERSYQFYVSPALLIPTIEGFWQMSRITSIQQSTLACCRFYDGSNWCSCCLSKTKSSLSFCCDLNGTASNTHKKGKRYHRLETLVVISKLPHSYSNMLFHKLGIGTLRSRISLRSNHIWRKNYSVWYVQYLSGFGGLGVACWPLVLKFAGSNRAEAVGFFRAKKSSACSPSEGK